MWISRHMKLIHKVGLYRYDELAEKARKGKSPKALMAFLVNQELKRFQ